MLEDELVKRRDAVLSWDQRVVDATVDVMRVLAKAGAPIDANDTATAGHAIETGYTLITSNAHEFFHVPSFFTKTGFKR